MNTTPSKTSTAPGTVDGREEKTATEPDAVRDTPGTDGDRDAPAKDDGPRESGAAEADSGAAEAAEKGDAAEADSDASGTVAKDDAADDAEDLHDDAPDDEDLEPDAFAEASRGVGAGAAAVVAAALGVVSLTGAWSGRVAAERETLLGQIQMSGGGSAVQQINEIYGDAWHTTAFVNGLFALLALLVGVVVLVRPAFGAPSDLPQPGWIRAVALAGVALGVLGVIISAGMYLDLFVALPDAPTAPTGG
ncbi:hypothetical protein OHA98_09080 [Streptomyces sp. NBC_00654]|uniref:hypothetical protein n=1 Tax=Streptomyces sp. NBC_00654 TaxID=2975799 RepID=UPI00225B29E6|nr:hypothetical protein [Streptomyces sp. NBC_00654]MCX4964983.1 hypothetical protein [Streptomyces sp. NBC_00654]